MPGLLESSLPIVVPVALIASNTIADVLADTGTIAKDGVVVATSFLGDPFKMGTASGAFDDRNQ